MGISLDGLASGLDTAELIASLMKLEAVPQTLLKGRVTATQTKITDFQSLNTKLAALSTLATTSLAPTALQTYSASSSGSGVTVVAGASATAGNLDITVTQTALGQTSVTAPLTAWPNDPPVLTIVGSDGVAKEITAASSSLNDVVSAINAAGSGVTATKVASGTNAAGEPQYRLQLVSSATGAASAFSVYSGSSADVTAGTATNMLTQPGAANVRTARDAEITLWAGTTASQTITSASNTFADLLPGVSVTVATVSADPVTVSVTRDTSRATTVAEALVNSISTTLGLIDTKSATTKTQDANGKDVTGLGSFTSDSTIRGVRSSITSAVSDPVNGRSPSEIGISIDKKGSIEFDKEKFTAAMAADPAQVEAVFAAIATRVAAAAESASNSTTGTVTAKISGAETTVANFTSQVDAWDLRLTAREASLKRTYSQFEVAMGKLNTTSTYLTSQFASLTNSNNK